MRNQTLAEQFCFPNGVKIAEFDAILVLSYFENLNLDQDIPFTNFSFFTLLSERDREFKLKFSPRDSIADTIFIQVSDQKLEED